MFRKVKNSLPLCPTNTLVQAAVFVVLLFVGHIVQEGMIAVQYNFHCHLIPLHLFFYVFLLLPQV